MPGPSDEPDYNFEPDEIVFYLRESPSASAVQVMLQGGSWGAYPEWQDSQFTGSPEYSFSAEQIVSAFTQV
jgi:putative SOS response-associated peptidase YedK